MKWTNVNESLPMSDGEVWIRNDENKVFLAVCWLERAYVDGEFDHWDRSWVDPILCNELDDHMTITHWADAEVPEFNDEEITQS